MHVRIYNHNQTGAIATLKPTGVESQFMFVISEEASRSLDRHQSNRKTAMDTVATLCSFPAHTSQARSSKI